VPGGARVVVLACGAPDRGDDGAAIRVAERVRARLPADVDLRIVGQLDVADLVAIPARTSVVVLDTAAGPAPGSILDVPLSALPGGTAGGPRSSHALGIPATVALAELIRGRPVDGRIVAIGGAEFGVGKAPSAAVARALPRFEAAVLAAVSRQPG
jgi:hydrogenase maturation protease